MYGKNNELTYCDCDNCCEDCDNREEPKLIYENLGIEETMDRIIDNDLLYSPKEATMVNFNHFNPYQNALDNIDSYREFERIIGVDKYDKEVNKAELNILTDNCISNIRNNITVIINTGIWKYMNQWFYADKIDSAYDKFYFDLYDALSYAASNCIHKVMREVTENIDDVSPAVIMMPYVIQFVNEAAHIYSGFINKCINNGIINIKKTNEEANKRFIDTANKFNVDISGYQHIAEYNAWDPAFIIAMANGYALHDIGKLEEIMEININAYCVRLIDLHKAGHLEKREKLIRHVNYYDED